MKIASMRSVQNRQLKLRGARARSIAEEHDLRERQTVGVCDGHERSAYQHTVGSPCRTTVKLQARRSTTANHLDVFPEDAARVAGAECFHGRFLRGEATRQMRGRVPPLGTIGNLAVGKHTLQEAFAVTVENRGHPWNVGGVETNTENVHARATA